MTKQQARRVYFAGFYRGGLDVDFDAPLFVRVDFEHHWKAYAAKRKRKAARCDPPGVTSVRLTAEDTAMVGRRTVSKP